MRTHPAIWWMHEKRADGDGDCKGLGTRRQAKRVTGRVLDRESLGVARPALLKYYWIGHAKPLDSEVHLYSKANAFESPSVNTRKLPEFSKLTFNALTFLGGEFCVGFDFGGVPRFVERGQSTVIKSNMSR